MANYVSNHIYITGSKQSIVDFLNKGLKNDQVKERVSVNMSGEEIVAFNNDLEPSLSMGSYFKRPKTFDVYDTTNEMKSFYWWWESTLEKRKEKLAVGTKITYPNGEMDELMDFIRDHKQDMPDLDRETIRTTMSVRKP